MTTSLPPIDKGEWTVVTVDHDKDQTNSNYGLSFQEMLVLLVPPMGIILNRNKHVTLHAWRNDVERITMEFHPVTK